MKGTGTILRLIDVVLILLIGFVAVADLTEKSRIRFPFTKEEPREAEEETLVLTIEVIVSELDALLEQRERIDEDGVTRTYDVRVFQPHYRVKWVEDEEEHERLAGSPAQLQQELEVLKASLGQRIEAVTVDPSEASPVKGTVVIYDICSRLDLPFPAVDLALNEPGLGGEPQQAENP